VQDVAYRNRIGMKCCGYVKDYFQFPAIGGKSLQVHSHTYWLLIRLIYCQCQFLTQWGWGLVQQKIIFILWSNHTCVLQSFSG